MPDLENLGIDDRLFGKSGDRRSLVSALNQSLRYIQSPQAQKQYRNYAVPGFTRRRVERSLRRFRQLVLRARSAAQLRASVQQEFQFYESVGKDGQGLVGFTGYYVPVQRASRRKTAKYRYPLYKLPRGFAQWKTPHPSRLQLEGKDGLQGVRSQLKGRELVYLADRLQAFLIHVQGSSRLQLTDGTTMSVGFAGATKHPYASIGKELIKDGKFTLDELTLPKVLDYFEQRPQDLDIYLPRNKRFVFFRNTKGSPPLGSLGYPVTGDRSIATDKSKLPPGALALIHTQLPNRQLEPTPISRFVLDQDTGSAIKGAGRVDVFLGTGDVAGKRAGLVNAPGKLYYLLLKQ
ncbi:MltA domain-containing protein [filamentous cyanobacterium LEGE 11480]|uniref:peptidoglycan lytic exotransglycosylase n=2 Tax=Romeriopsis TaxID=2992131 RepID=A0A928VR53_9CYAN|nr:MltA domain-containing protein [Romeriopsis navalis LEGE 11480]